MALFLRDPAFSRSGTLPACNKQTDRQTDLWTHDDSKYRASR